MTRTEYEDLVDVARRTTKECVGAADPPYRSHVAMQVL